jgi:membrane protein
MKFDPIKRFIAHRTQIFSTALRESLQDELFLQAASLAFISLLAFIPFFVLVIALFQFSEPLQKILLHQVEPFILSNLGPMAIEKVLTEIEYVLQRAHSIQLGWIGLSFLALTSFSLCYRLERILDRLAKVEDRRSWRRRVFLYLVFLGGMPLFFALSFSLRGIVRPEGWDPFWAGLFQEIFTFILILLLFAGVYVIFPSKRISRRAAFQGALMAGLFWKIAHFIYGAYVGFAGNINVIYGTLAAVPLFLIWLQLTWALFLFGAKISFVITALKPPKKQKTIFAKG